MTHNRDTGPLFLLWAAATAYNITKPYHLDDAAHLLIAQWIAFHPLHPMQGLLNWSGYPQPIAATNQPHLYFYLLAAWGSLFGFGEVAMHILQSGFTAAAIWLMHRLSRRLAPDHALFLTALLVLNPAFFVEQNLMVDVPLLSLWLGFFVALVERRFALAGLACAAAILTKYSSLCLLPILAMAPLLTHRPAGLSALAIPLAAIAAWSGFNLWDDGGIHILGDLHVSILGDAHVGHASQTLGHLAYAFLYRLLVCADIWLLTAGALCPFGVIALVQSGRLPRASYLVCAAGLLALAALVASRVVPDKLSDALLFAGFAANGAALLLALRRPRDEDDIILWLWLVLTTVFYLALSPFIAARHVLLILPPLTLLAVRAVPPAAPARMFALGISLLLSLGLGLSDYRFAAFYRAQAAAIPASLPGARITAAGHWGWQYYAARHGMAQLDILAPPPPGSFLAVAREVDHSLPANLSLQRVQTITGDISGFNPFCTGRLDRLYVSGVFAGPWSLSADCAQHIDIFLIH
jgi:hypothetical protein